MGTKNTNSFLKHINRIKHKIGFTGLLDKTDYNYLYQRYMLFTIKDFEEETIKYLQRKREEN